MSPSRKRRGIVTLAAASAAACCDGAASGRAGQLKEQVVDRLLGERAVIVGDDRIGFARNMGATGVLARLRLVQRRPFGVPGVRLFGRSCACSEAA